MALWVVTIFFGGGDLVTANTDSSAVLTQLLTTLHWSLLMVSIATDWLVTPQWPASLGGVVIKVVVVAV
jgi:hypothetical protein